MIPQNPLIPQSPQRLGQLQIPQGVPTRPGGIPAGGLSRLPWASSGDCKGACLAAEED